MSRGDWLDISRIDSALLSLLEPRFLNLFRYNEGGAPKWLTYSPFNGADEEESGALHSDGYESLSMLLLRGCLSLATLVGRISHRKGRSKDGAEAHFVALADGIQTPAMRLAGVTLEPNEDLDKPTILAAWQLKQRKIKWFILLSIVGPMLHRILYLFYIHNFSLNRLAASTPNTSRSLAFQRQRKIIHGILSFLDTTLPLSRLFTLVSFLYRTPVAGPTTPALYFSGLHYTSSSSSSSSSTENVSTTLPKFNWSFAHRRALYDQVLKLLNTLRISTSYAEDSTLLFNYLVMPFRYGIHLLYRYAGQTIRYLVLFYFVY